MGDRDGRVLLLKGRASAALGDMVAARVALERARKIAEGGALSELHLAEPVDHEEHDLSRPGHRLGEPRRQRRPARVGQLAEQGRDHVLEARALPVRQDRIGLVPGLHSLNCLFLGPWRGRLGGCAITHEGTPYDPHTPSTHEWAGRITVCEGFHAG